jgi:hypothetical protein
LRFGEWNQLERVAIRDGDNAGIERPPHARVRCGGCLPAAALNGVVGPVRGRRRNTSESRTQEDEDGRSRHSCSVSGTLTSAATAKGIAIVDCAHASTPECDCLF